MKNPINIQSIFSQNNNHVFTIAEIGINHGGSIDLCAKMIEAAALSGADSVKLQIVNPKASYVEGTTSYKEFSNKVLSEDELISLMKLADKLGILLFSTPGDFESLDLMLRLKMGIIKISSGLMSNIPLIEKASKSKLPLIISTGMALEEEIDKLVELVVSSKSSGLALLKCTALYPAPDNTINLSSIKSMRLRYNIPIGYSDHTLDDLACIGSVVAGASIIEKHFTLDKTLAGADHYLSIEPQEFKIMVEKIRRVSKMVGSGIITTTTEELGLRNQRYRCLIAKTDINIGDIFSEKNVGLMRPLPSRVGLPASEYHKILGKRAITFINKNEPINDCFN
jgi:N,N'-diacetyllegionaminate synthase